MLNHRRTVRIQTGFNAATSYVEAYGFDEAIRRGGNISDPTTDFAVGYFNALAARWNLYIPSNFAVTNSPPMD